MAGFDTQVVRVVIRGTINGIQTWSTGFFVGFAGTPLTTDDLGTVADDIRTLVDTAMGTWRGTVFDTTTVYDGITCYLYEPHTTVASAIAISDAASPEPGTLSTHHAAGTSVVQSLRTPFAGRSQRGRMYLPATGAPIGSDHNFNGPDMLTMAETTATLLSAINAHDWSALGITASAVVVASFTKSATTPVVEVIVDTKPDEQRRRSDKIPVTASESAAVTS